jgi:hypothetical protein
MQNYARRARATNQETRPGKIKEEEVVAMTFKIASWLLSVGLSTLMLSAQSKIAVAGTDPPPPQASTKPQSGYKCAAIRTTNSEPLLLAVARLSLLQTDACADPIDQCHDPVKYLGANDNCACFACEYGRTTQHNVCTNKQADKDILLRRSR